MKVWVLAAAGLLVLNGALLHLFLRLSAERDELETARTELLALSEEKRAAFEHSRRVAALVQRAAGVVPGGHLELAGLRDVLLEAERGLDLHRSSLDVRSARGAGGAQSVQASLSGSFPAIYRYLGRLEGLRWPFVLEEVAIRPASGRGRLVLDLRSTASLEAGEGKLEFSPAEVARLEAWLSRRTGERSVRDPFATGAGREPLLAEAPAPVARPPSAPAPESLEPPDAEPALEIPQLTGFVLARPELESDVSRRVLAAIRFEGGLRLVKVGDALGAFRVDRIEARESVVLVHEETGERITLWLE